MLKENSMFSPSSSSCSLWKGYTNTSSSHGVFRELSRKTRTSVRLIVFVLRLSVTRQYSQHPCYVARSFSIGRGISAARWNSARDVLSCPILKILCGRRRSRRGGVKRIKLCPPRKFPPFTGRAIVRPPGHSDPAAGLRGNF